jgi:hypothetical protein
MGLLMASILSKASCLAALMAGTFVVASWILLEPELVNLSDREFGSMMTFGHVSFLILDILRC